MSQVGIFSAASGPGSGAIFTIDNVGPDGSGNFTLESTDATITFTPVANGLNLSVTGAPGDVTSLKADTGSATPTAGAITIAGGTHTTTSASGSTLTIDVAAGAGLSLGAFGSTPNADGLSLTTGTLVMEPASGSDPGGVSTTTQTFAGAKTFSTSVSSPEYLVTGSGSGVVSILPQAAAGTYNFNLPTTAGTSGYFLTSAGGAGAPMTWTNAGSGFVNSIAGTANEITASASTGAVTLSIPSTFIAPGSIAATTSLSTGANSGTNGSILINGSTSGTISILPQVASGTYNFNLPITAGTSGYFLTSAGGAGSAMTWTSISGAGGLTTADADTGSATPTSGVITWAGGTNVTTSATGSTVTINVASGAGLALGAFGSTPNADGLSLTTGTLTMQPADGTHPGGVSTTTQTLAGAKTFSTSVSSPEYLITGSGSGTISILPQAAAGTYNFNLPITAGTSGYFLTSAGGGSSAMTWTAAPSSSITITGDTGGGLTGNSFTFTGGTTGITFAGSGTTETLGGTLVVANGGTGVTSVTVSPTATAFAGWDANKNFSSNSFIPGYATTATAAALTTLAVGDKELQYFTGTTTQTVKMPVTSTLVLGQQYIIVNNSSGVVTVESSGANTIQAMAANTVLTLTVVNTGVTTAAGWNAQYASNTIAPTSITITGDSGGGLVGNSFTFTGGSTGLTFSGAGSTETLGGTLALASGGTSASLTASNGGIFYSTASAGAILAGTATANQVLLSGSSTTPAWSTATYPATTTINQILYSSSANVIAGLATANNGVLITGTTGIPSILADGTTGQILTATTGNPPSWENPAASSISITGDSGGALTGAAFTFTGGSTGLTFAGSGSTETLGGDLVVANGGTGNSTFTAYSVITAGTTATGVFQNVVGVGTTGQVLTSAGASALPAWQSVAYTPFVWTTVSGGTQAIAINNGYVINGSGCTLTLPATAAVGSFVIVKGLAGTWIITANTGQTIVEGATASSSAGTCTSALATDSVQMTCIVANTKWSVDSSISSGLTYA